MRMRSPWSGQIRRRAAVLTLLFCVLGQVFAAPRFVQNRTDYILYLKSDSGEHYRQVPPGGLLPIGNASMLRGFVYDRGSFQLSTIEIDLGGQPDTEFVTVRDADLSNLRTLSPSDVADTLSAPRLDNRYLEWLPVSPLFARGRNRAPLASFVDSGGGRQPVNASDAMLWERSGTDLEWMKTLRTTDDLFIATSAYSSHSSSSALSLFIYGDDDLPAATIDIDAGSDAGLVMMWMPLHPEPTVVGNSVAGDYFVEAQIWLDVVVDELSRDSTLGPVLRGMLDAASGVGSGGGRADDDGTVMLEIATASSAAGVWEEFVLARVPFDWVLSQ